MKVVKKIPKWIWIIILLVILLMINFLSKNNLNQNDSKQFTYDSNNSNNSEFEYDDIDEAELAEYDKYVNPKAPELILNQKIYLKISSIENVKDESTATKKKFSAIVEDHDGKKWKIISYDDKSYVESKKNNIKLYGLYRGIEKNEDQNIPVIEVYTRNVDSDYIDKNKYKEISSIYIDKVNKQYTREKFSFDSFNEWTDEASVVYSNKSDEITLDVYIDLNEEKVTKVELNFDTVSINIDDVDREFLYSVITCYDQNLTEEDAETMITMAEANALLNSTTEHLKTTENQPMTPGVFEHKNNKITIVMYIKQITLEKCN